MNDILFVVLALFGGLIAFTLYVGFLVWFVFRVAEKIDKAAKGGEVNRP